MRSFLEEVLEDLRQKYDSLEDLVFVLPNRRAGTFLKHLIGRETQTTLFAPEIFSIEQFVEAISVLFMLPQLNSFLNCIKLTWKLKGNKKRAFSSSVNGQILYCRTSMK